MKVSKLRELSYEDLEIKLSESLESLQNFKFQQALQQLEDGTSISKIKKEIAQLKTIIKEQMQNPGAGRSTGLVLTSLQNDDQGLEVGSLFQYRDAAGIMGQIKIVVANQPNLRGNSITGSVGSVTVTT